MAESFSSPGDVARTNKNAADSAYHPHPQPDPAPYEKDTYEVIQPDVGTIQAPLVERSIC